jgi:hypothetical protein
VQSTRTVLWSVIVYSVGLDVAQLSLQRHQGTLILTTQGFGNYLCWKRKKLRLDHWQPCRKP